MTTVRLTAAQAMVRWLAVQEAEPGVPFLAGVWAIDLELGDGGLALELPHGTPNGIAVSGPAMYRANGEEGLQVLHSRLRQKKQNGSINARVKLQVLGDLDMENAGSSNSAVAADGFVFSGDGRGGILVCRTESEAFDK